MKLCLKMLIKVFSSSPSNLFTNLSGYEIYILRAASDILKFEYEFSNPEDLQWGKVENGSFTGMVGDITRGVADFGLGALVTDTRLQVIASRQVKQQNPV